MAGKWIDKLLWPVVTAIVVGVATPTILSWLQERSAKIIVRQFYNTVEPKTSVPTKVGGLTLNYQPEKAAQSRYLVEVANVGKRADDDVRVQVQFPEAMGAAYDNVPDFKIYRAEEISFAANTFFMSLKQFPAGASAAVPFTFGGDARELCRVVVKAAGKENEGRVEPLKGMRCDL